MRRSWSLKSREIASRNGRHLGMGYATAKRNEDMSSSDSTALGWDE